MDERNEKIYKILDMAMPEKSGLFIHLLLWLQKSEYVLSSWIFVLQFIIDFFI